MAQSSGICRLCDQASTKQGMLTHLKKCAARDEEQGEQSIYQLRVQSPGFTRFGYWLDIELRQDARLVELDQFLRQIWLECCYHLSSFRIGDVRYSSRKDEWALDPNEKSMDVRIDRALGNDPTAFRYEYDYGSTTVLQLRVTGRRKRRSNSEPVRVLARNDDHSHPCNTCGSPAVSACALCSYEEFFFACEKHEETHDCEDEAWYPVRNTPRMGVCGFGG